MSIYARAASTMNMRHIIDCSDEELRAVFELFTMKDSTYLNGTSFMVTSEPTDGRRRVYMSDASYERFQQAINDQEETLNLKGLS